MSVSLSVHRIASVKIDRYEREGHCWTKFRMLGTDGFEIFTVDVFSAYFRHVDIIDERPTASIQVDADASAP